MAEGVGFEPLRNLLFSRRKFPVPYPGTHRSTLTARLRETNDPAGRDCPRLRHHRNPYAISPIMANREQGARRRRRRACESLQLPKSWPQLCAGLSPGSSGRVATRFVEADCPYLNTTLDDIGVLTHALLRICSGTGSSIVSKKIDTRVFDTRRIKGSGNVFLDLGFSPAEARIMALHAEERIRMERHLHRFKSVRRQSRGKLE